jgi:hypothetical protein
VRFIESHGIIEFGKHLDAAFEDVVLWAAFVFKLINFGTNY